MVVPRVCQALRELERPFVIVLDDLHKVHNPEALGPLPELAASLNAGSTLAITSREEPDDAARPPADPTAAGRGGRP